MTKREINGLEAARDILGQFDFREFSTLVELHFLSVSERHAIYDVELLLQSVSRTPNFAMRIRFHGIQGLSLGPIGGGLAQIPGLYIDNIAERGWEGLFWKIGDFEDSRISFHAADVSILSVEPCDALVRRDSAPRRWTE
jgi:hypothetical protein